MENIQELSSTRGPLWSELYMRTVHLIKRHPIEECIQNLNAMHSPIHNHPDFIREYTSTFLSSDSDSPMIQYAVSLKKYKHLMVLEQQKLMSVLHSLSMVQQEELPLLLPSVQEKIDEYVRIKKRVCDSVYRLFEYVVEYEQLNSILTHPSLQPSSDPLPVPEAPVSLPLEEESMEPSTPSPGLHHLTLLS